MSEKQFFLGSNTKRGFVSLFEQLRDPVNDNRLYILKGGPGSGKSTLMRRIAKALEEHGHYVEYIPCASDPHSLDAIYDRDAKTAIIDGTAPHTMDPNYPGAYDIILNLGDAWDSQVLAKDRKRIIELCNLISQCHSMATSCITSAAALLECNKTAAKAYVNQFAVISWLKQFYGELEDCGQGKEHKRLLSAVSVGKTVFFDDTLITMCPKLYVIPDEWGAASDQLLSGLRDYAISNKLDFFTCYCSIQVPDKIDHLLFPSAKLGFTTANFFHTTGCKSAVPIDGLMNPMEYTLSEVLTNHLSVAKYLIKTAGDHVEYAKKLHDELEQFYIESMDFSKVNLVYDKLLEDIINCR